MTRSAIDKARIEAERAILKRVDAKLRELLAPVVVSRVMDAIEAPIREREQAAANDNAKRDTVSAKRRAELEQAAARDIDRV